MRFPARRRSGQDGFSLVEILAAFLILTLVITVSFAAFLERNKRLQQASEIVLAYQALANEAEFVRRDVYDNVITTAGFQSGGKELLAPLAPYSATVTVDEVKPGLKNVKLTIRWKEGQREATLNVVRVATGGGNLF